MTRNWLNFEQSLTFSMCTRIMLNSTAAFNMDMPEKKMEKAAVVGNSIVLPLQSVKLKLPD